MKLNLSEVCLCAVLVGLSAVHAQAQVLGLQPKQYRNDVSLAWDPSPDSPAVTNYFIYYGPATATYTNKVGVGNVLTTTITNLVPGATYYFAATASTGAAESLFSNEVAYTVPRRPLPPALSVVTGSLLVSTNAAGPWTVLTNFPAILVGNTNGTRFYRAAIGIE